MVFLGAEFYPPALPEPPIQTPMEEEERGKAAVCGRAAHSAGAESAAGKAEESDSPA